LVKIIYFSLGAAAAPAPIALLLARGCISYCALDWV
jgi:hypothetical protein